MVSDESHQPLKEARRKMEEGTGEFDPVYNEAAP